MILIFVSLGGQFGEVGYTGVASLFASYAVTLGVGSSDKKNVVCMTLHIVRFEFWFS